MRLEEKAINHWGDLLRELTARREVAIGHTGHLRGQERGLALEAAMGSAEAKKRFASVNAELARAALEVDDLQMAIAQAEAEKRRAEEVTANDAERDRQEQIAAAPQQYSGQVREIDDAFRVLAGRFDAASQSLVHAESLMTASERAPIQQLHGYFGPTLAAAHFGLGEHLSLGREAAHMTHRKPFETYVMGFIDRWVKPAVPNGDGEV